MHKAFFSRLVALCLTLALTYQVVVPVVDGLVFHSESSPAPTHASAHWDPPGGCQDHADHCALNLAPLGPRVTPAGFRTLEVGDREQRLVHLGLTTDHHSCETSPLQARAPPVVL